MAFSPAQSAFLADLLTGIGQGFMSAPRNGPPLAGFAMGLQNANQLTAQRQQTADQQQEREFRARQMQRQEEADAEARQQKAATASAWSGLIGEPAPGATPKFVGGAGSGPSNFQQPAAPAPNPLLAGYSPEQLSFLRNYGHANPGGALSMVGEQAFATPKAPTVNEGMQYNPKTGGWDPIPGWLDQKKAIAEAGRAPVQPKGPSELKQRALDAGLTPGTPEYRNFMLTGGQQPKQRGIIMLYGPAGERKSVYEDDAAVPGMIASGWTTAAPAPEKPTELQQRAKDSGLAEGTPEYQQFMKTNGKVPEGPGGTFGGTSIDAQDSNIVLKGQSDDAYRATPEYAMAWTRQYMQPHIIQTQDPNDPGRTINQAVMFPVPQGLKTPTGAMPAADPAPAGPQGAALQPGSPDAPPAPQPSPAPGPTAVPIPGTGAPVKLNGEQSLSKGFSERMDAANIILSQPAQTAAGTSLKQGILSAVPGGNYLKSSDRQTLEQAQRNFINAQLRRESGAAISPSEFENARQQYFPQPGDGEAVLKQKAANRAMVIRAMKQSASPYPLPEPADATDLFDKFGLTPKPPSAP